LFGLLRDRNPSLLLGNYAFGRNTEELRTLTGLTQIAAQLRAPFIGTAAPPLLGCDSFARTPDPDAWNKPLPAAAAEIWTSLRNSPAAHYCGLAAPRFLARQPYGRQGDPIESFPFEELSGVPVHESFLWGEAGILCACAIIDGLQSGGVSLADVTGGEVSDLPVHKFTDDGEIAIQPYAEIWLTDRAIDRMHQHGVTPLVGLKNANSIRIPSLRSVAVSPTRLLG
jgi:type VI secretion system protein ImpC